MKNGHKTKSFKNITAEGFWAGGKKGQVRVALYARVSTKDKGQNPANQLRELREFVRQRRWKVAHEYVDKFTGSSPERKQFLRMMSDASRRHFDVILFWSLDRFSKEGVFPTLQYLQRLTDYGVGWRSFTEQYLDSTGMFRDAVIGILAAIAKQENIRISERVRAGLEQAREDGKVLGRPATATAKAGEVMALRKKGLSKVAIARELKIGRSSVGRILSNERRRK